MFDPEFERLLDEMLAAPARRAELTAQMHARFSRPKAILVLDMCGYSRITEQRGVIAFLLMIRRMRLVCAPCFREHGGKLVKAEADDLVFSFDSVSAAVVAAREAHRRVADANRLHPADDHLRCAIGIGFGPVLWFDGGDIYGLEVNLASKLGEDIARAGQILLTAGARCAIDGASLRTRAATVSISGLELSYHEVLPPGDEL